MGPSSVNGKSPLSSAAFSCAAVPARLAKQVASADNSQQSFKFAAACALPTHRSLACPVFCKGITLDGDVIDSQKTLDVAWVSLQQYLQTETLSEQQLFDVLQSGILQTRTGRTLADLLVETTMRSIRPEGDLTTARLREIVDVLCHLPPDAWENAFGEQQNFSHSRKSQSVTRYIQSQLMTSRHERLNKMTSGEWLSDVQWFDFRQVVREVQSSISPSTEGRLDSTLSKLQDASHVRPSAENAKFLLGEFLRRLSEPAALNRLPFIHQQKLNILWKGIGTTAPSSAPVECPTASSAPEAVSFMFLVPPTAESGMARERVAHQGGQSLLSMLDEVERTSDFYDQVVTGGPRITQGFAANVLYVTNLLNTIEVLPLAAKLWNFLPEAPATHVQPVVTPMSAAGQFERFAQQFDDLLTQATHVLTGWRPAEATLDFSDPRALLHNLQTTIDQLQVRVPLRSMPDSSFAMADNPYAETVVQIDEDAGIASDTAALHAVGAGLWSWLQAAASYLAALRVITLNTSVSAVQQHPHAAATLAMTTIYTVANEFYSEWFQGNVQASLPASYFAEEADPELRSDIIYNVGKVLDRLPALYDAVSTRFGASTYGDPHQDPQLVEDIEVLLQRSVPAEPNLSNAELIEQTVENTRDSHGQRSLRKPRAASWTADALSQAVATFADDRSLREHALAMLDKNRNDRLLIPTTTSMHQPVQLYKHTLSDPRVLAWINSKGLDLTTLCIRQDSVTGSVTRNGATTTHTYSLCDNSGWWHVSAQVLAASQLLDPADIGLPFMSTTTTSITREMVLQFYYGITPAFVHKPANVVAHELKESGLPISPEQFRIQTEERLEHVKQSIGEAEERIRLSSALTLILTGMDDNARLFLHNQFVEVSEASPLAQQSLAIRRLFRSFLDLPEMVDLCDTQGIHCNDRLVRISEGRLEVRTLSGGWFDLTDSIDEQPALKKALGELIHLAKQTGNALYSAQLFDLQQVIQFKGFDSPKNAGEARNVIQWLDTVLPPAAPLGNYAAVLLADDTSPTTLTSTERATVIELAKGFVSEEGSILDALVTRLLPGTSLLDLRHNTNNLLNVLFDSDQVTSWGQELLQKLNWYGAQQGQTASNEDCQQLLLASIKLSVDADTPRRPGTLAGYDIYKPENMGRDLAKVRADIEEHLRTQKGVSARTAPLVTHLFLADIAPEFLVQNVPGRLRMGSAAWMYLRLGTAIAETKSASCSRAMTYGQVMALAMLEPTSTDQLHLFKALGVDILMQWGVLNGIYRQRLGSSYSHADYLDASSSFSKQRAELNQGVNASSSPLITRKELAVSELLKVFPGYDAEQLNAVKLQVADEDERRNMKPSEPRVRPLVEVYMTDELVAGRWKYFANALNVDLDTVLHRLPSLSSLLEKSVSRYYNELIKAYVSSTRLVMSELPLEDRQALELGRIDMFTVRQETGIPKEDETAALQAKHRGRYGVLIRCEYGETVSYFEVFVASMTIIKRTDLQQDLQLDGVTKVERAKISKGSTVNVDVQRGTAQSLDFQAYSTGSLPIADAVSTGLIIEKLGETLPGRVLHGYEDPATYIPNSFFSPRIAQIAKRITEDNFFLQQASLFEFATGELPLEKARVVSQQNIDYLLQLVPFVGCAIDLSSGERMRLINGAFGCFSDLTVSLFAAIPSVGKVTGAWKSVAPFKTKAFETLTIGSRTLNTVLNPLDGLFDFAAGGMRGLKTVVFDRVSVFTEMGIGHIQTSVDKLRCFFGSAASNAVSVKFPNRLGAGGNVPAISRGFIISAVQVNDTWYATNPRLGNPFGAPLEDFVFAQSGTAR